MGEARRGVTGSAIGITDFPPRPICLIITVLPFPKGEALTREIDLATAVSEIRQACDDNPVRSPFFVIAGAGISYPSVPLASKIAEDCQSTAAKYNRTGPPRAPCRWIFTRTGCRWPFLRPVNASGISKGLFRTSPPPTPISDSPICFLKSGSQLWW